MSFKELFLPSLVGRGLRIRLSGGRELLRDYCGANRCWNLDNDTQDGSVLQFSDNRVVAWEVSAGEVFDDDKEGVAKKVQQCY